MAIVVLGGGRAQPAVKTNRAAAFDLPGRQLDLLESGIGHGHTGSAGAHQRPSAVSVNWADKFVPAILEAWYPRLSKGGIAIADVLFGDYNPGGKLPTVSESVGQIPMNFPCKPSSQIDGGKNPGAEGNMSRVNGPLYAFGHGLSYTTFEYSDLQITPAVITPHQKATVTCRITSTGRRAGDEVVQLYVRDMLSSVTTYEKNLAGFERVHLQPGGEQGGIVHPRPQGTRTAQRRYALGSRAR